MKESGSNQPETRLSYTPTFAWYFKNNATTIAQAATPVDVLTSTSTCQTEAPAACPGTADEIRTTVGYQAGSASQASNVLPVSATQGSGSGNLTATTSVGYDNIGNVTASTGPLGANQTTVYFYDADREKTGFIGPNPGNSEGLPYPATQITYNADGLVTKVQTGTVGVRLGGRWW